MPFRDCPLTHQPALSACPGCGAPFAKTDGPTHAYIGASAGCWAAYGEILAREYDLYRYPDCHRLTVDAYAVQHPGVPSRKSIQSVGVHLISLHLTLEKGLASPRVTLAMQQAVTQSKHFVWLTPPLSAGPVTVVDVGRARSLTEHVDLVGLWGRSVWDAWSSHHATVRGWAAAFSRLDPTPPRP